jgi:hypothetical protein
MEESYIDQGLVPESNPILKELEGIAERNEAKQVTISNFCFG